MLPRETTARSTVVKLTTVTTIIVPTADSTLTFSIKMPHPFVESKDIRFTE